jgi:hypothetical protein
MIDYQYDNSSIIVNLFLLALYIDVLSFDKFMYLAIAMGLFESFLRAWLDGGF